MNLCFEDKSKVKNENSTFTPGILYIYILCVILFFIIINYR